MKEKVTIDKRSMQNTGINILLVNLPPLSFSLLDESLKNQEAQGELKSIFYWIKHDKKSQRLYNRYKSFLEMPLRLSEESNIEQKAAR